MNAKIICVKSMRYLLLYNLHDCTFNIALSFPETSATGPLL